MTASARGHKTFVSRGRFKSYHSWSHHHLTDNIGEEKVQDVATTEQRFFNTSCNIIYEEDNNNEDGEETY